MSFKLNIAPAKVKDEHGQYQTVPMFGNSYDDTAVRNLIAGKYTKPASGIPAADIADGVIPKLLTLTQEEYDLLETPDPNVYYFIVDGDTV